MAHGPATRGCWQSQLHTQRGWAKHCLIHGCRAVLPSTSPGARQLWDWYGRILVLVLNAHKHQHTKRPKHQGVKRCSHQSLALGAAVNQTLWSQKVKEFKLWGHGQALSWSQKILGHSQLPDNQSQGVQEKILGHGPDQTGRIRVHGPDHSQGVEIWGHGQIDKTLWSQGVAAWKIWAHGQQHSQQVRLQFPHTHSALGDQLRHQSLKTQTSTDTHPHSALGAMQRHQALLRRT